MMKYFTLQLKGHKDICAVLFQFTCEFVSRAILHKEEVDDDYCYAWAIRSSVERPLLLSLKKSPENHENTQTTLVHQEFTEKREREETNGGEWWVEEKFFYFWAIFNSKSRVYEPVT